jgi:hypothetical protein
MVGCTVKAAWLKRAWTPWSISLALVLFGSGISLIADAPGARAQSGNAAALASLRGQIQRYGCNLPQYTNSVSGCRALHARMKTLESGGGASVSGVSTSRSTAKPYSNSSRYTSSGYSSRRTPRPSPTPSSSGGGFFGSLFGGGGSSRSRNAGRYSSYGMSYQGLGGYGRYRTLCVRTCDGYYFPVSFSTTRSGVRRDANVCQSSCQVPTKLFYHRNPGADVQHMVDLQGKPYVNMENAFRYREEYVPNCRCKPEPWSVAAKEVYEQRAELAETPGQLDTVANATQVSGAPNGFAYPATATPGGAYPRPRSRRKPRSAYRANDPEHTGRWWAGSW